MSNVTTTTAIKWQSDTTQASSNIHPHPGQKLTNKIDIKADSSFCYIQGIKRKILYTSKLVYCHYTWIYAVLICLIFMWFCIISSWLWAPEEDAGKCIELQCAIKVNKMIFLGVLISQPSWILVLIMRAQLPEFRQTNWHQPQSCVSRHSERR